MVGQYNSQWFFAILSNDKILLLLYLEGIKGSNLINRQWLVIAQSELTDN